MTLRTVDFTGKVATRNVSAIIDTVAPPAPTAVAVDSYDSGTLRAELAISTLEDGVLADGSPGSGLDYGELRWRAPGGTWSNYIVADGMVASVDSGSPTIEVEARVRDAVGNVSLVYTTSVTLQTPTSATDPIEWQETTAPAGAGGAELVVDVATYIGIASQPAAPDKRWRVAVETPGGKLLVDDADANGEARFPGLTAGTYTLRRIGVPDNLDMRVYSRAILVAATGTASALEKFDIFAEMCKVVGNGFFGQYCNLTAAEKDFTVSHPVLAYNFAKAADKAIRQTLSQFNGPDDPVALDATKANAFQHSYWTGLMTKRVYDLTVLDRESLALRFATAHESEQRRRPEPSVRTRSAMDRHNNYVGHSFAKKREANRKSDVRICTAMRRATFTGAFGNPSTARAAQLAWVLRSWSNTFIRTEPTNTCP